jgi:shikimate kinase
LAEPTDQSARAQNQRRFGPKASVGKTSVGRAVAGHYLVADIDADNVTSYAGQMIPAVGPAYQADFFRLLSIAMI